jgi:hypothetical protein
MSDKKKLSDQDMARVAEYLQAPIHRVSRAPFKPLWLMLALILVVTAFSVLSVLYAAAHSAHG